MTVHARNRSVLGGVSGWGIFAGLVIVAALCVGGLIAFQALEWFYYDENPSVWVQGQRRGITGVDIPPPLTPGPAPAVVDAPESSTLPAPAPAEPIAPLPSVSEQPVSEPEASAQEPEPQAETLPDAAAPEAETQPAQETQEPKADASEQEEQAGDSTPLPSAEASPATAATDAP